MAMTLANMRSTVWQATASSSAIYTAAYVDRALHYGLNEMVRVTGVARTSYTATLTANIAEINLASATGFRPERFLWGDVTFNDQSTWLTATAYAVRDLVQGDGDPDSFLYKCIAAHTSSASNEPGSSGGSTYWTRVYTKIGDGLIEGLYSYADIRDLLINTPETGSPERIAFEPGTVTTGHIWPVPDLAYKVQIHYKQPLTIIDSVTGAATTWTYGDSGNDADYTNVPDEYLFGVLWYAAPAVLDAPTPDAVPSHPMWRHFVEKYLPEVKGQVVPIHRSRKRPERYGLYGSTRRSWIRDE